MGSRSLRALAVGALAAGALVGLSPGAHAGTQSIPGLCSGRQIDSAALSTGGVRVGTVYLHYNASTGRNCAYTEKLVDRGTRTNVFVYICVASTGRCVVDDGDYLEYAGPRSIAAPGQCITWGGGVTRANGARASYASPAEHCG